MLAGGCPFTPSCPIPRRDVCRFYALEMRYVMPGVQGFVVQGQHMAWGTMKFAAHTTRPRSSNNTKETYPAYPINMFKQPKTREPKHTPLPLKGSVAPACQNPVCHANVPRLQIGVSSRPCGHWNASELVGLNLVMLQDCHR